MNEFLSILKGLAPTIASAIGGPLAGMAVTALADAIGVDPDKVADVISSGKLTGEQVAAIKKADQDFEIKMKELDIKLDELAVTDRRDARAREAQTGSKTTPALAWIIVLSFVIMVFAIIFSDTTVDDVLTGTLIGYLSAKCEQVLSYYFGSSLGSARKDVAMTNFSQRKN